MKNNLRDPEFLKKMLDHIHKIADDIIKQYFKK